MASKTNYLVKSAVKDAIAKAKMRSSGDALEGLNIVVDWYVSEAIKRAKANGRQTVRGHDFSASCK